MPFVSPVCIAFFRVEKLSIVYRFRQVKLQKRSKTNFLKIEVSTMQTAALKYDQFDNRMQLEQCCRGLHCE